MTRKQPLPFAANGRDYRLGAAPRVVICVDGCAFDYLTAAARAGSAPFIATLLAGESAFHADGVMPSFTNPNNLSIVSGVPPSVHGISGNYFWDPAADQGRGAAVMMNDPAYLRAGTLLAAAAQAGARVAVITAKDKLLRLLAWQLDGIAFSAEKADEATLAQNGIDRLLERLGLPRPDVYSAELSAFVFAAGVHLAEAGAVDLMYLSTTDYVQHKYAPGSEEANAFYAMIDRQLSRLDQLGWVIGLTADHGMNAKHDPASGAANVIYLQDLLDGWLGERRARVILPITDPYVVHHGALGSFATVYLAPDENPAALIERLSGFDGIERVLDRQAAAQAFELPADRIGDLVVVSQRHTALGSRERDHDLSALTLPLRSHGGLSELEVPLLFNRRVDAAPGRRLRNFDVFDLALNGVED